MTDEQQKQQTTQSGNYVGKFALLPSSDSGNDDSDDDDDDDEDADYDVSLIVTVVCSCYHVGVQMSHTAHNTKHFIEHSSPVHKHSSAA